MLTIQNECLTLSVDPLGAQMMELNSRQGTRYLWDGNPDYWSGRAPVLFPFVARMMEGKCRLEGQIYQMGIHGFAKLSAFSVEEQTESSLSLLLLVGIAAISLLCCIFQFWAGHKIGHSYGHIPGHCDNSITAGQAIGQKNTVFAIWMGYTFLTPETSIVGGFYSIWHNLYNTWQLRQTPKN